MNFVPHNSDPEVESSAMQEPELEQVQLYSYSDFKNHKYNDEWFILRNHETKKSVINVEEEFNHYFGQIIGGRSRTSARDRMEK